VYWAAYHLANTGCISKPNARAIRSLTIAKDPEVDPLIRGNGDAVDDRCRDGRDEEKNEGYEEQDG
jgi:hypothetical protein